jgi:hypothetical protein
MTVKKLPGLFTAIVIWRVPEEVTFVTVSVTGWLRRGEYRRLEGNLVRRKREGP